MKIIGSEGMDSQELNSQLQQGARFVIYYYCISIDASATMQPFRWLAEDPSLC